MTRCTLVLSVILLASSRATAPALAACPSGYPNEIFCDDFDTYCTGGGYPGSPDCSSGASTNNALLQTVWKTTSRNDSTNTTCGTQFTVDIDPKYLSSTPFGGRHPCLSNDPIGQQSVSNWNENPATPGLGFLIQNVFPGFPRMTATDGAPLVLEFYLSGVDRPEWSIGGGLSRSSAYMELALGDDRANTDYANGPNCSSYCNPSIGQGPFPILCAIGNPENNTPLPEGCPPIAQAPVHAALAVGTMNMLDPDPCHCGVQEHGGINWHLTVYDGQLWWTLRNDAPRTSTGTVTPDPVNPDAPMPPPAGVNTPGDFTLLAGKPDGFGPANQWVKLTIRATSFDVEMIARERSAVNGNIYRVTSVMHGIPRAYLGCFDQLRGGVGAGCPLANTSWTTCGSGGRRCLVSLKSNANAVIFDDVVLHGGAACNPNGACCLDDASCVDNEARAHCEDEAPNGLGGKWRGAGTTCGTLDPPCCPVPFADTDHDDDVDVADFAALQRCLTIGGGTPTGNCACFNRDGDADVDGLDLNAFLDCVTGPAVSFSAAPPPACVP
ncbi:MAG: hypothetical protein HY718_21460 [Planctomycetes bacterium]|nr:hypothetical protein [Planctomycetota bacterium]